MILIENTRIRLGLPKCIISSELEKYVNTYENFGVHKWNATDCEARRNAENGRSVVEAMYGYHPNATN